MLLFLFYELNLWYHATLLFCSNKHIWCVLIISFELGPFDLPFRKDVLPVLQVTNLGHLMHAFVNGQYVGSASS